MYQIAGYVHTILLANPLTNEVFLSLCPILLSCHQILGLMAEFLELFAMMTCRYLMGQVRGVTL